MGAPRSEKKADLMAQGVPIMFGRCDGGPWHERDLAHHEPVYDVPIERASKKVHVAMRRGKPGYDFGEYRWDGKVWAYSPPPVPAKSVNKSKP